MKESIRSIPLLGFLGTLKYYLFVESYYRMLAKFGKEVGVTKEKRDPPVIVSLTTIPERLAKVSLCIESLLRQSLKPDYLILWISEADAAIPPGLEHLTRRGMDIKYCKDIRSYKKIIYTLREFSDSVIVTADDDLFYPRHWLKDLYDAYQREPTTIHCHRAHLMAKGDDGELKAYEDWKYGSPGILGPSKLLFPTGAGGVLYPPGSLDREVLNEQVFMSICPTSDDTWLKAMSLLRGVACKKVRPYQEEFTQIKGTQTKALWKENVLNKKNDEQIKAVFERYGLLRLL